ncbi:hypothetical protein Htur_5270 (plasmid) [Haloterrigena turkmenica DSM 5511]|uniref:Uncharacterized protein n=1 Tax=Haloterrigena turkmenica (strain ATCC 51198 / DSM 5511 / JCM 9101 / NCIMB 13204 / VKM B-1734 / 4k) TaxID=543526 RepID=D2S3Q1_HALTV|nr:hypothetical protein Htur_5270 [Haloterrigena turkmenica DSM 5511]
MYEALEAEAEAEEKSISEYIRSVLRERENTQPNTTEYVDRIRDLEERVDELEKRIPERNVAEPKSPTTSKTRKSDDEISAALEGFRPGRNAEERAARRESAHAALEWLRDQPDAVTAGDVKHALYDDHGIDGQTEQTWWTETARKAFRQAAENGYVEIDGRSYEWTGGREA